MKSILIAAVTVLIFGCSSAPPSPAKDTTTPAGLGKAKRLQATQAIARDRRFLDELRSASISEHSDQSDDSIVKRAKKSLMAHLLEPESVLFRGVAVSKTHGFPVVCGQVSAKSTGGEFRRFFWVNVYLSGIQHPASPDSSFRQWQESEDTRTACPI